MDHLQVHRGNTRTGGSEGGGPAAVVGHGVCVCGSGRVMRACHMSELTLRYHLYFSLSLSHLISSHLILYHIIPLHLR